MNRRDRKIGSFLIYAFSVCWILGFPIWADPVVATEKSAETTAAKAGPDLDPDPDQRCGELLSSQAWFADNQRFYDELPARDFMRRAHDCGLLHSPDLKVPMVQYYLRNILGKAGRTRPTRVVMEIGSGYGRILHELLNQFPGIEKVHAVELSGNNAATLRQVFGKHPRVTIRNENILNTTIQNSTVDVALWMWAGFLEIPPEQKPRALRQVFFKLRRGGVLIMDLPVSTVVVRTPVMKGSADFRDLQMVQRPGAPTLHLHFVTKETLIEWAEIAGFKYRGSIGYTADPPANTERNLHLFVKN
ncbi:MAG: class I SAM-dependent methyltransferase [Deltaproteobacteria bacterium]|nr:class I SAM-dependent methyltransferase [Deltaproteobacteria bacterium]